LGIAATGVTVIAGDTSHFTWGLGTWASRAAVVTANAAASAALSVRNKALEAAARWLEVSRDDLELHDGRVQVSGAPDRAVRLADLAATVGLSRTDVTTGGAPGLDATEFFSPPQATFAAGVHAAVIEVEPTSGLVTILRYVVAHDCGKRINPLIVDGQIHGGVAQGIGNAFYEQLRYDADGQLLTASLMDYLLPTANDVPLLELTHLETPSPTNPLGVKGVGEAGAIPVPALMASALADALSPLGVHVTRMPVGPAEIADAIVRAQHDGSSRL
jgi:CO/xanthine dehydrogenase Mo-binding subunit